jgi:G-patch domain
MLCGLLHPAMQVTDGASQPGGAGESYGRALLERMGWTAGTGLGAKRDGVVNPIDVKSRVEKLGVGAQRERPFADSWWETMMVDAYGKGNMERGSDLLVACEGRRCRPHGAAKLARVAAADDRLANSDGGAVGGAEEKREDLNSTPPPVKGERDANCERAMRRLAKLERMRAKEERQKQREQRRNRKALKENRRKEREIRRMMKENKRAKAELNSKS